MATAYLRSMTGQKDNIAHLIGHPNFQFIRASITDEVVLDRLASEVGTIVRLAAAVGVQLIVEQPTRTIETNIMGTEAVLKAALRYGCRVLLASTSEVYGKGSKIPFSEEDDILLGAPSKSRWGYAASKMVDEFFGPRLPPRVWSTGDHFSPLQYRWTAANGPLWHGSTTFRRTGVAR